MPANGRRDLIRRLKVKLVTAQDDLLFCLELQIVLHERAMSCCFTAVVQCWKLNVPVTEVAGIPYIHSLGKCRTWRHFLL